MLVLTRKVGEKIWIGEDVCLTVVQVDRGKVRLGIEAPRDVNIRRAELEVTFQTTPEPEVSMTCC
jgi:carbon storage regulator